MNKIKKQRLCDRLVSLRTGWLHFMRNNSNDNSVTESSTVVFPNEDSVRNVIVTRSSTVVLPDEDAFVKAEIGGVFSYIHSVYGSVGYSYAVEWDESAFDVSSSTKYDNPDAMKSMEGADSGIQTTVFKALKKGTFTIKVMHYFRGHVENTITYKVVVN